MATAKTLKRKTSRDNADYSTREVQDRFERAVDIAVATKPIHRAVKKPRKRATSR